MNRRKRWIFRENRRGTRDIPLARGAIFLQKSPGPPKIAGNFRGTEERKNPFVPANCLQFSWDRTQFFFFFFFSLSPENSMNFRGTGKKKKSLIFFSQQKLHAGSPSKIVGPGGFWGTRSQKNSLWAPRCPRFFIEPFHGSVKKS